MNRSPQVHMKVQSHIRPKDLTNPDLSPANADIGIGAWPYGGKLTETLVKQ